MTRRSSPPRLVVRTSVATLATVAVLLSAVFVFVTLDVRERVRAEVTDKLEARLRVLSALEDRRGDELASQVAMLAENSTLKAALDIYQSEMATSKPSNKYELVSTVTRELEKIAARVKPDILAVTDASGRTVAGGGPPQSRVARPACLRATSRSSRFVLARRRRVSAGERRRRTAGHHPGQAPARHRARRGVHARAQRSVGGGNADRHIRHGPDDDPPAGRCGCAHSDALRSLSSSARSPGSGDGNTPFANCCRSATPASSCSTQSMRQPAPALMKAGQDDLAHGARRPSRWPVSPASGSRGRSPARSTRCPARSSR